jgi:hypothetical protein
VAVVHCTCGEKDYFMEKWKEDCCNFLDGTEVEFEIELKY